MTTRAARIVTIAFIAAIIFASPASAAPTNPLCQDGSYRKAHPLICDTGDPMPGLGPSGGGGSDGGLLGIIGRALGGLTGGLL